LPITGAILAASIQTRGDVEDGARVAEPDPNSASASSNLGDADIDRLLAEAESLTREVAEATGVTARDADSVLSGEASPSDLSGEMPPGDPLAAVDAASQGVMSLEDLLSELGPAGLEALPRETPRETTPEMSCGPAPQAMDAEPPAQSDPASGRPMVDRRAGGGARRTNEPAAGAGGPRVEHVPEESTGVDSGLRVEHMPEGGSQVDGLAAVGARAAAKSRSAGETSLNDPKPAGWTARFKFKLLIDRIKKAAGDAVRAGPRGALRGLKWTLRSVGRGLVFVFAGLPIGFLGLVDIPFHRIPKSIKTAIGILGLITAAMGGLAWAMPDLMRPKPVPKKTAEAEGEGEGGKEKGEGGKAHGEEAKGHGEAPKGHESGGHGGGH